MGHKVSRGPAMRRICWWSVDRVSRLLEPDERDAVRGDLTESGASGGSALREVLGLVVRRQAALWLDWRPWLALVGVVVPLGMLLGLVSRNWADGSAIYAWLYVNNWTWGFVEIPGARRDLADTIVRFTLNSLTLIGWSWTSGFVLGSLSRRTTWANGSLFCLAAFGGTLAIATVGSQNPFNAAVFSLTFYSTVWPIILLTVLVALPALAGMRQTFRLPTLPLLQTFLWAVLIAILTARAKRGSGPLGLLSLLIMWPVGYMIATAGWQRWRGTAPRAG